MSRRGENIYKRKDGRWEGRIRKENGKYQYLYSNSYRELKQKMYNKPDIYNKQDVLLSEQCRLELKQQYIMETEEKLYIYLEKWLMSVVAERVKPSTRESYYYSINKYIIPFWGDLYPQQINDDMINKFVTQINNNDKLSNAYKRKILSICKTAFSDITEVKTDPKTIKNLKLTKVRCEQEQLPVFTLNEQNKIVKTLLRKSDKRSLGILLCFNTGIRIGELCALQWKDVFWEEQYLNINRTVARIKNFDQEEKNTEIHIGIPKSFSSNRKIPLTSFAINYLKQFVLPNQNSNQYILSTDDCAVDPRNIQRYYKKILEETGITYRKFHSIRHTFATRLLESGVDIKTLSDLLGHSNATITLNVYSHSMMEQKKLAIRNLSISYTAQLTKEPIFSVNEAN